MSQHAALRLVDPLDRFAALPLAPAGAPGSGSARGSPHPGSQGDR